MEQGQQADRWTLGSIVATQQKHAGVGEHRTTEAVVREQWSNEQRRVCDEPGSFFCERTASDLREGRKNKRSEWSFCFL
uniref:Uncharacterized protein n=1 Tax=Setaria viridis TaxID=4556 RepID=A0A4U6UG98_SETVI|nr:hypothetical protein SEVIR_5G078901v2 [Setaria viridis]